MPAPRKHPRAVSVELDIEALTKAIERERVRRQLMHYQVAAGAWRQRGHRLGLAPSLLQHVRGRRAEGRHLAALRPARLCTEEASPPPCGPGSGNPRCGLTRARPPLATAGARTSSTTPETPLNQEVIINVL